MISFLSAPETHGDVEVERIDTHISHVFVAGERAFKLKRAIRRNFLDYSTVARRRAACRREVQINRLIAPEIYLGCRAVVRTPGGLALAGDGPAIDWVVEMVAFDRDLGFDRLAEKGRLSDRHIIGLADAVAAFHRRAPRADRFGGAANVAATIDQIASAIVASSPALAADVEDWQTRAGAELNRRARQIDARRRHGYVRRCHGDLHLGNVCLFEERPTPFDAIEFSEEIASTDVLYDTAFAVMDLLHRGEWRHANLLVNRYLARTQDYSGVALMPLFISMRAAVRAIPAASKGRAAEEAAELLTFATGTLTSAADPRLIAIGGLSGSGKSTVAQALAPEIGPPFGAVVIRSDVTRKIMEGVAPEERLPQTAYGRGMSREVYARMRRYAGRTLRAGMPTLLDATFLDPTEREAAARLAGRTAVPFRGIWLRGSLERLGERLRRRIDDASDATSDLLPKQADATAAQDWCPVSADAPLPDVVAAVTAMLLSDHAEPPPQ